ncbi:MAG: trypsin-like peptidase domain-containing protein [Actinomycetota bacterium]
MTDEPGLPSGGNTPSGADGEREQKRARTRFGIEVVVAALVVGGVAGGIAGNLTAGHEAAPSTVVTTLPAALNSTVAATTSTSATTTTAAATRVGGDPDHDLAVLRIERTDPPALELGNNLDLQVGDTVIAAGNALNLDGVVVGVNTAGARSNAAASRPTHPLT